MKKNITLVENTIFSTNTARLKLTQALIEYGFNVTVLSSGPQKEMDLARSKGFNVIDIGGSNTNVFDVFRYIRNLRAALIKTKPDIVLTFTMRPAIWGNLVTWMLKIPTLSNISGIGPLADSESFAYTVARILYRFALKKTAHVFFQNTDDMKIFLAKKFISKEQAIIIPGSGVDFNYFGPRPKLRNDGKFVFLFISRLIKDKGIIEYVESAKALKHTNPSMVCQVLGPYYSQNLKGNIITEKQVMIWLDNGIVKYLGACDDVRPFVAEADCIVLPSYREGMSNVLLEAGSMEKPCITSDATGCKDIVIDGETGFLCKVKDTLDLQQKMQEMMNLSEAERQEMGRKARERVKTVFAKQIVVDAYINTINSVLNASS
jgi:glycosyltransferase involved in cell wall biosynthesis